MLLSFSNFSKISMTLNYSVCLGFFNMLFHLCELKPQ